MLDIEDGIIVEDKLGIVKDGTELCEDDIRALRVPDVNLLWEAIKRETYPMLYDDNGALKEFEDDLDDGVEDKKKV